MIVGVSGMFILLMMWRSAYAPTMYRTIREFGHEVCPKCGYWLRGLGEEIDHCPECGAKREAMQSIVTHEPTA
jgi:rubrerythrin